MKHAVLIALAFLIAVPANAGTRENAQPKIALVKTSGEQRALTEVLSARIKSALLGERYSLDAPRR